MSAEIEQITEPLRGSDEGAVEITDQAIVRAEGWLLQEFERALMEGAQERRLTILLHRDLLRCVIRISWRPAADPRDVGIWRLA